MGILSRVLFLILISSFSVTFTSFTALAEGGNSAVDEGHEEKVMSLEEAKALIDSLGSGKDATKGSVRTDTEIEFYDIYSRQIAFRENTKDFRESLEQRRENYKKVYIDLREDYKKNMEAIYRAEIAAYQEEIMNKSGDVPEDDAGEEVAEFEMEDSDMAGDEVSDTEMEAQEHGGLKEEEIPVSEEEEGHVKKKVVTSDDAPDFNPEDLAGEEDDSVWDEDDAFSDEELPQDNEEELFPLE